MRRRLLSPLLVLATLAAAGCGSTAPGPKPVAEAWAHALGTADYVKVCDLVTPGVRAVMVRYSDRHSERGCPAQARDYLGVERDERPVQLAARTRSVARSGAQAEAVFDNGADSVLLVRAGSTWRVTVPGLAEQIFGTRMDGSCAAALAVREFTPLAPGKFANLATFFRRRAADVRVIRGRFAAITPTPSHARAMRRLLKALDAERRDYRRLAALVRAGASRTRLNAAIRRIVPPVARRERTALADLRPGCGSRPGDADLEGFRTRGARICRRANRSIGTLQTQPSPGAAAQELDRFTTAVHSARRALARLHPPDFSAPAFKDALRLTALSEREFRRGARALRAYDLAAARKSGKAAARLATRAANGFARVGIPGCGRL